MLDQQRCLWEGSNLHVRRLPGLNRVHMPILLHKHLGANDRSRTCTGVTPMVSKTIASTNSSHTRMMSVCLLGPIVLQAVMFATGHGQSRKRLRWESNPLTRPLQGHASPFGISVIERTRFQVGALLKAVDDGFEPPKLGSEPSGLPVSLIHNASWSFLAKPVGYTRKPQALRAGFEPALSRLTAVCITVMLSECIGAQDGN